MQLAELEQARLGSRARSQARGCAPAANTHLLPQHGCSLRSPDPKASTVPARASPSLPGGCRDLVPSFSNPQRGAVRVTAQNGPHSGWPSTADPGAGLRSQHTLPFRVSCSQVQHQQLSHETGFHMGSATESTSAISSLNTTELGKGFSATAQTRHQSRARNARRAV